MHTPPFASCSRLSLIPTRLSLEHISAHNLVTTPPPSSGAQAHYERHPPQLSKCSYPPPPLQFSPPEERRRSRPASTPYTHKRGRRPLRTRPSHGRGLWSPNSRKENDQDHAVAPPRPRSIVGTTAMGRAKKKKTTSLSLFLSSAV